MPRCCGDGVSAAPRASRCLGLGEDGGEAGDRGGRVGAPAVFARCLTGALAGTFASTFDVALAGALDASELAFDRVTRASFLVLDVDSSTRLRFFKAGFAAGEILPATFLFLDSFSPFEGDACLRFAPRGGGLNGSSS